MRDSRNKVETNGIWSASFAQEVDFDWQYKNNETWIIPMFQELYYKRVRGWASRCNSELTPPYNRSHCVSIEAFLGELAVFQNNEKRLS